MAKQIDGVIEAVRLKNGQVAQVRAYERRGKTYSDRVVLDRKTLMEKLEKGENYVTGSREELLAGTFKLGKPVMLVKRDGRELLATRDNVENDELENALFF